MPGPFCEAVRKVRVRLVAPPLSVQDYLATLTGRWARGEAICRIGHRAVNTGRTCGIRHLRLALRPAPEPGQVTASVGAGLYCTTG